MERTSCFLLITALAIWCSCAPKQNAGMNIREVTLSDLYHGDPYYRLFMVSFKGPFSESRTDSIHRFVDEHFPRNKATSYKREYVVFMEYDEKVFHALDADKASKERMEWYHHLLLVTYQWKEGSFLYAVLHRKDNDAIYQIMDSGPYDDE